MWAIDNLKSDGTTVSSIEYTFDACGQVTEKDEYNVGETEYSYDAEGQLTEVSYPAGNTDTFTYDNNGNRTEWARSSNATVSYIYNSADQLTQSTEGTIGTSYSHDNNGNLTGETTGGVTKTFNYDPFDRMSSVVQGQTTLQSMTYGPDSKRLSLTDSSGTRKFFYDGNDVIQEYDSNWSTVRKEYTHGPWVDEPLSMTDKTAKQADDTYYLMKDRLGSIIDILDENETLKTTYSYDAFGEPTATYHSGQVDCMYRFTGRVYDGAMGAYFYRARYYNQSLGRFFSRDPIMSLSSLYAYCNNSPQNFTDPFGMLAGSSIGSNDLNLSSQGGDIDGGIPVAVPGPWWWWIILPCSGPKHPVADAIEWGWRKAYGWAKGRGAAKGASDLATGIIKKKPHKAAAGAFTIGVAIGEGLCNGMGMPPGLIGEMMIGQMLQGGQSNPGQDVFRGLMAGIEAQMRFLQREIDNTRLLTGGERPGFTDPGLGDRTGCSRINDWSGHPDQGGGKRKLVEPPPIASDPEGPLIL